MLYTTLPDNFKPKFEVASCFIEYNNQVLMLHRQEGKVEADKWGLPGGKVDSGETTIEGVTREVFEETSIKLNPSNLYDHTKLYVRYPEFDFVYHMYKCKIQNKPEVKIRHEEHKDYEWKTINEWLNMPLLLDFEECIKIIYNI